MKPFWLARPAPMIGAETRCDDAAPVGAGARLRRVFANTSGVTGIEFAMVGPIFLLLILGVLENGLTLWTQSVLDNATRDAARLTLTGQSQNGGTAFATQLCNEVSGFMKCSALQYRIQTGSTFAGISPTISGTGTTYSGFSAYPTAISGSSLGNPGDDVLVQVVYTRTYIVPWVGHMMNASGSERIISTAAFENEPY
jgi:Flp pilus assembly protein TadG